MNPQGVKTTYEFDLGVDTGYGTRIFGEAGSGSEAQTFNTSLAELTPATTYHFRLIATNMFGTSYGADETFTTPAIPGSLLSAPAPTPLVPAPPSRRSETGAGAPPPNASKPAHRKPRKRSGRPSSAKRKKGHVARHHADSRDAR